MLVTGAAAVVAFSAFVSNNIGSNNQAEQIIDRPPAANESKGRPDWSNKFDKSGLNDVEITAAIGELYQYEGYYCKNALIKNVIADQRIIDSSTEFTLVDTINKRCFSQEHLDECMQSDTEQNCMDKLESGVDDQIEKARARSERSAQSFRSRAND